MWMDGREYDGGWVNGKQSGEGYYKDKNGVRKKGIWAEGKRERWID